MVVIKTISSYGILIILKTCLNCHTEIHGGEEKVKNRQNITGSS